MSERDWIFTFGFSHVHLDTGERLKDYYVRIHGTYESARKEMVRRFGTTWGFQYESEDAAGVDEYNLKEFGLV